MCDGMKMSKQQILKDLKHRGFSPTQIKQLYKVRDAKYTLSQTGFEVPSVEFTVFVTFDQFPVPIISAQESFKNS